MSHAIQLMLMFWCNGSRLSDPSKLLINSDRCRNKINKNIIDKQISRNHQTKLMHGSAWQRLILKVISWSIIAGASVPFISMIWISCSSWFHSSAWLDSIAALIRVIGDATTAADELVVPLFIALTTDCVIAVWAWIASDSDLITGFVIRVSSRRKWKWKRCDVVWVFFIKLCPN